MYIHIYIYCTLPCGPLRVEAALAPLKGTPAPKLPQPVRTLCGSDAEIMREVPWAPQGQARSDTKTPQGMMKEVLSPLSSLLVAFCKYFCRSLLTISASPHHPFWCLAPSASGP